MTEKGKESHLLINNNDVRRRRVGRERRARSAKRGHGLDLSAQRHTQKYNLWCPDDCGYELLRDGITLVNSPKKMHELGSLKEKFLWHFKSTSDNVTRLQSLDKCSLYEAVFKVEGVDEGSFVYPTHDQLAQIYKGFTMSKVTSLLDNGVPYVTDKRLRRYMREKRTRSQNTKKTREKKKRRRRQEQTHKISMEQDKYENAPVRIDWKIAFPTPKNTIKSINDVGCWAIPYNPRNLPKRAKLQTLIKRIDSILGCIGKARALTDEEREEERKNAAKELEKSEDDEISNNNIISENSIKDNPLIFNELDVSADELSYCYMPGSNDFSCREEGGDEDSDMDIIYDDLAVTAVTLKKHSTRQKMLQNMEAIVSQPAYQRSGMAVDTKSSKLTRKRPLHADNCKDDEDDEINALFECDDSSAEEVSAKRKKRSVDKIDSDRGDKEISCIDERLRDALTNKGTVPGIPDLWYQMYEQLGFELSLETIKKTSEYILISGFLK